MPFIAAHHVVDEQLQIFFLHYWGTGPVENLARADWNVG
jgi:hypothetical protein